MLYVTKKACNILKIFSLLLTLYHYSINMHNTTVKNEVWLILPNKYMCIKQKSNFKETSDITISSSNDSVLIGKISFEWKILCEMSNLKKAYSFHVSGKNEKLIVIGYVLNVNIGVKDISDFVNNEYQITY